MSIIVSNCQHCDEQQFQTPSYVHYTILSVVNLGSFIRALILDCILALEKTTCTPRVHLVLEVVAFMTTIINRLKYHVCQRIYELDSIESIKRNPL